MKKEVLEALKGSIRKWEHVVDGSEPEAGSDNCPLCQLFDDDGCYGCPVFEANDNGGCSNDEWLDWCHHAKTHGPCKTDSSAPLNMYVQCPECVRLAQKELDFLKSLLPEGEQHD